MSDYSSTVSRPISPVTDPPPTARPYRFHWIPASARRAGPGSVSETTEGGQGDSFPPRSPAELLESSLPLGALPPDWSSSKHGFNGPFLATFRL
jgi:vacuolar protein sorting-associated protein 54